MSAVLDLIACSTPSWGEAGYRAPQAPRPLDVPPEARQPVWARAVLEKMQSCGSMSRRGIAAMAGVTVQAVGAWADMEIHAGRLVDCRAPVGVGNAKRSADTARYRLAREED